MKAQDIEGLGITITAEEIEALQREDERQITELVEVLYTHFANMNDLERSKYRAQSMVN
jgi:hypothetical protein